MSEYKDKFCNNRRDFLVSVVAGSLVLSLSIPESATAQTKKTKPDNHILKFDEKSPLAKMGGFQTIDTKFGKVLIVNKGEMSFKAFSATCPHKGGPMKYDEQLQKLICPWHDSKFDLEGKNLEGPAEKPLQIYTTDTAITLSLSK